MPLKRVQIVGYDVDRMARSCTLISRSAVISSCRTRRPFRQDMCSARRKEIAI